MPGQSDGLLRLRRLLERSGSLPEDQWREFAAQFRRQRVPKHGVWLTAGQQATHLGFVLSGVFRLYYTRGDGKELNKSFIAEDDFLASIHSLLEGVPSRLSIQALVDAELLSAPYSAVQSFYERDMFWQRFGRLMSERLVIKKLEREAALLMDSAAERYEAFLREHPAIEARVPDHHVARYLGVTPEALSRIKARRSAPRGGSRSARARRAR